jgi:hypothetical protein
VCELLPGKCVEQPEILGVILFTDEAVWPPSSPDLNPCDFFLWGHLKQLVYWGLQLTMRHLVRIVLTNYKAYSSR